jgi:hypothetical protein
MVFISHATNDKLIANAICAHLEGRRIPCWIAPRDILPGVGYGSAIIEAINQCSKMVVVLSHTSNLSKQVIKEVERAVSKGLVIIPFRIEDIVPTAELEYFLSSQHWLDAVTPPFERHLELLGNSVLALESADKSSGSGNREPARPGEHAAFQEVAPDEWRELPQSVLRKWITKLFSERL